MIPVRSPSRLVSPHGRSLSLLLPEPRVPAPRPTRRRQPLGLRSLRQGQQQIRLLHCRACKARFSERKGTPLFHSQLARREGRLGPRASGRGQRGPSDRAARRRPPRHRHAAGPQGRGARQGRPRRTRGLFPPRPARSSSMRSGRSSPRSRRTATPTTRPTTTRGTGGTPSPMTPRTGWSWPSSPGPLDRERRGDRPRGPRPHRRARGCPAHQRRAAGLRDGDRSRLWRPRGPRPPGSPGSPGPVAPAGLTYATIKERQKGRVVAIVTAVVLGTWATVAGALERSGRAGRSTHRSPSSIT